VLVLMQECTNQGLKTQKPSLTCTIFVIKMLYFMTHTQHTRIYELCTCKYDFSPMLSS
jgi:hypothetical protein